MEVDLAVPNDGNFTELNLQVNEDPITSSQAQLDIQRVNAVECTLFWKNVKYVVREDRFIQKFFAGRCSFIPSPTKTVILKKISGYAEPRKFLAIIGASGAGKTTMLNILANRMREGSIKGEITANGENIKKTKEIPRYTKLVGYVMQHDAHLPFLTVRETLFYAGMLTLPRSMTLKHKLERIRTVTMELGLDKCVDSYVGNNFVRGISGGESKRLSIAIELLRDPAILFLDEPTTGLDANTSLQICKHLKELARKYHHTVITTIHQPRKQIFDEFDNLMILAPGGRQVYFGPAKQTLEYFKKNNYHCPVQENPADYFLDIISIDFSSRTRKALTTAKIDKLVAYWEKEPEIESPWDDHTGLQSEETNEKASWFSQVFWVMHRETINDLRNFKFNLTRFIQNFVVSFILGWIFFRLGNEQSTITDRTGLLFFIIIVVSYHEMLSALTVFISQRDVLYRERDSGFYSTSAYWAGKQLALLPSQLLFPAIFAFCSYWLSGLQTLWYKFFIFFAVIELVGLYCSSLGLLLGAAFPPTIAVTLGPLTNVFSTICVGFLANLESIPVPLVYVTYLSYARWAYDAVVQNEFNGLTLECKNDELSNGVCPFTSGEDVLDSLQITGLDFYQDMAIIAGFIVIYKLLLYPVLRYSRPVGR
mmetsp:Transcript_23538/g.40258  ORF Transcript_23538/g.40258 Transcript_23538/m.40258 type:complete len:651 (+) Transcript_23538:51-2003(+)